MPTFLLVQFFRGKREAGWLILPTALVSASIAQSNIDTIADTFHLRLPFDKFFRDPATHFGPLEVAYPDLGDFLFLLAMGVVMFFRFTRINREQARSLAEIEAARTVQQVIIPEAVPSIAGFLLESVYLPAGQVGGDFFQVVPLDPGGALIVIGDVSGKGIPAAMTVSLLVGTFRTLAHYTQSPGEILTAMNDRMIGRNNGGFTTCLVLRADPHGKLIAANAGHLSPYLNGAEIAVDSGLPLGLSQDSSYPETTFSIAAGQQLTLLTDGVIEAQSPTQELFGFDRTAAISIQSAESIAHGAQHFGQEDDITVLTLSRTNA